MAGNTIRGAGTRGSDSLLWSIVKWMFVLMLPVAIIGGGLV